MNGPEGSKRLQTGGGEGLGRRTFSAICSPFSRRRRGSAIPRIPGSISNPSWSSSAISASSSPWPDLLAEVEALQGDRGPARPRITPSGPESGPRPGRPAGRPRARPRPVSEARPPSPQPAPRSPPRPRPTGPAAAGRRHVFARVLEGVQKEKPALAALLAQYSSFKVTRISTRDRFRRRTRSSMVRRPAIRSSWRGSPRPSSRPMRLRIVDGPGRAGSASPRSRHRRRARSSGPERSAMKDPTVQFFMNTFKAQVLSVDPVKTPEPAGREDLRRRSDEERHGHAEDAQGGQGDAGPSPEGAGRDARRGLERRRAW